MTKTLFYRLFGLGRIPRKMLPSLEAEEIVVSDEGIGGWFITKDFKAPGKRFWNRKEGFSAWIVVTKKRIVLYTYWKRQINISVDDPKIRSLYVAQFDPHTIAISFESSEFHDDWNGIIKFRLNTSKAKRFYNALTEVGVQQGSPADSNAPRR